VSDDVNEVILKILGYDLDTIPENATWEFVWTFADSLESWRIFVFLGVIILLAWAVMHFYRRESDVCPKGVRIFLGVVRIVVILVLAAVFLGPAIQISQNKTRHSVILVLIDDSLSMLTRDKYLDDSALAHIKKLTGKDENTIRSEEPNRIELIKLILEKQGNKFIRDLTKKGNVKVLTFSSKVGSVQEFPHAKVNQAEASDDADSGEKANNDEGKAASVDTAVSESAMDRLPAVVLKATGQGTNLARAVRDAIKSVPGSPIAAIVLITDGQNTAREDDPLAAAEFAGDQTVPIYTMGVGEIGRAHV